MRDARRKYFGFEALGEIVRRLLGFNARIVEAERTVAGCAEAETGRVEAEAQRVEEFAGMKGTVDRQAKVITDAAERVDSGLEGLAVLKRDVTAAEQERQEAEEARATAEAEREVAEETRTGAEQIRVEREAARADSEKRRAEAETARTGNEEARVEAETGRTGAEQEREEAERKRAEEFKGFADTLAGKADVAALSNVLATDPFAGDVERPDTPEYRRLFIDMWNELAGSYGRYNRITGFFELNGLTDITYGQAVKIYRCMQMPPSPRRIDDTGLRTNLWLGNTLSEYDMRPDLSRLFRCATLEKVRVSVDGDYGCLPATIDRMFARGMPELTEVLGMIDCYRLTDQNIAPAYDDLSFPKCHTLKLKRITRNVRVCGFPALSSQSLQYWIGNAVNTAPITITVHPDVYAKLMDETNAEWHALVAQAAAKNIQFATV